MLNVQIGKALWATYKVQFQVRFCSADNNSVFPNVKNSKKSSNEFNSDLKIINSWRFNEKMLKGIGILRKLYQVKAT